MGKFWDIFFFIWLRSPVYGVTKQTFLKISKSNSKFFEKSTSPKDNIRGAVTPILLEIELRWIPNFFLRTLSPTRWWNNFWAIFYRFWDRHFGLVFFRKKWKCDILGGYGSQPIEVTDPSYRALHSPYQPLSFKSTINVLPDPIWPP